MMGSLSGTVVLADPPEAGVAGRGSGSVATPLEARLPTASRCMRDTGCPPVPRDGPQACAVRHRRPDQHRRGLLASAHPVAPSPPRHADGPPPACCRRRAPAHRPESTTGNSPRRNGRSSGRVSRPKPPRAAMARKAAGVGALAWGLRSATGRTRRAQAATADSLPGGRSARACLGSCACPTPGASVCDKKDTVRPRKTGNRPQTVGAVPDCG